MSKAKDALLIAAALGGVYVGWVVYRGVREVAETGKAVIKWGSQAGEAIATGNHAALPPVPTIEAEWLPDAVNVTKEENFIYANLTAAGRNLGKFIYDTTH